MGRLVFCWMCGTGSGGKGGGCDCAQGGVAGSKKCMVAGTFLGVELEMI